MSVFYQVSPNTYMGTGFKEHISRLRICLRREPIAYTSSESIMLIPP